MTPETRENLRAALSLEATAAARQKVHGLRAEQEKRPQSAALFRALAAAEEVHLRRFLRLLRGRIGTTDENLQAAFETAAAESVARYTRWAAEAEAAGDRVAAHAFDQTRRVAAGLGALYGRARSAGRPAVYHVCPVCGNIVMDRLPENCPICGAISEKFKPVA